MSAAMHCSPAIHQIVCEVSTLSASAAYVSPSLSDMHSLLHLRWAAATITMSASKKKHREAQCSFVSCNMG